MRYVGISTEWGKQGDDGSLETNREPKRWITWDRSLMHPIQKRCDWKWSYWQRDGPAGTEADAGQRHRSWERWEHSRKELPVPWIEAPTCFKYLKHIQKVLRNIMMKEFQENKVQDVPHPDIDSINLLRLKDKERILQAIRQTMQTKWRVEQVGFRGWGRGRGVNV